METEIHRGNRNKFVDLGTKTSGHRGLSRAGNEGATSSTCQANGIIRTPWGQS